MTERHLDPVGTLLAEYEAIDLSQRFEVGMPSYPTHSRYFHELWESYWHGDVAVAYQLILNEHSGTHVDAPGHFIRDGHPQHIWIDEVNVTSLMGRAVRVDVSATPAGHQYDVDVMETWEKANGPVEAGDIVLFYTGWARKWALRPDSKAYLEGWPGPTRRLAEWLRDRRVRAVGCDNIGFDVHGTQDFPAHYTLLADGILIMENLTNLDRLPPTSLFLAFPLKIAGGSGSPIRAVAFVPRKTKQAEGVDAR